MPTSTSIRLLPANARDAEITTPIPLTTEFSSRTASKAFREVWLQFAEEEKEEEGEGEGKKEKEKNSSQSTTCVVSTVMEVSGCLAMVDCGVVRARR